jgi:hypothetical protein
MANSGISVMQHKTIYEILFIVSTPVLQRDRGMGLESMTSAIQTEFPNREDTS